MDKVRFDEAELYFDMSRKLVLGTGSFGTVVRAMCTNSNKNIYTEKLGRILEPGQYYAIKILKKECLTNQILINLVNEIEILKVINHQYCVKLYDAFQSNSNVYLVMEYVKGVELFDLITSEKKLNETEAIKILTQLTEALNYLHMRRIVHRDIKPENILITDDTKDVKLIDFGFARFMGNLEELSFDPTDNYNSNNEKQGNYDKILVNIAGSLEYMAPEILNHIMKNGPRPREITCEEAMKSDMYSMGVVSYALIYKKFPFGGTNIRNMIKSIAKGAEFPNDVNIEVPKESIEVCRSLLESDYQKRPFVFDSLKWG